MAFTCARRGGLGTSDTVMIPLPSSYRCPSCTSACSKSAMLMRRPWSAGVILVTVVVITCLRVVGQAASLPVEEAGWQPALRSAQLLQDRRVLDLAVPRQKDHLG